MHTLALQLRTLSKDHFESLVHHYLLAQYPGTDIKRVDGSGGDGGVDCFSGELATGPAIWQAKHFPNRIKQPQRRQIVESIKAAFQKRQAARWTLCLPIDLRTSEHEWFQTTIVAPKGGPERIKLLQASDFLEELFHNRPLRDAFFPNHSLSQMAEVRKVLTQTEAKTPSQVSKLTTEYGSQEIDLLRERDPRLEPVIAIGGKPEQRAFPPRHGLALSIQQAEKTIHFYARDPTSFNLAPPKITFSLRSSYGKNLEQALDTGMKLALPVGSVMQLSSDSTLLQTYFSQFDLEQLQVAINPTLPANLIGKQVGMRLVAGYENHVRTLPYVPFVLVRVGRRELELRSRGSLPMQATLVLRQPQEEGATLSFRPILVGADVKALHRIIEFLSTLEETGALQVFGLDPDVVILKQESGTMDFGLKVSSSIKAVVADAAIVSEAFATELHLPNQVEEEDAAELRTLRAIATGEELFNVDMHIALTKEAALRERVLEALDHRDTAFRIEHHGNTNKFMIFGKVIEPGPLSFVANQCCFVNPEDLRNRYEAASEGEAVPLTITCAGPCFWSRTIENALARAAVSKDWAKL